ncbi:MAG: UDP-3-O-acyl-N-acetylglucosamine deacetylase [Paracoccaceae bacterium]
MQHTLKRTVSLIGTGLHSGRAVRMSLHPAAVNAGISFRRTDIRKGNTHIRAMFNTVNDTGLCTRIANEDGVEVSTIEHLMAAFAGLGLSNVLVELDGPEVPIMDGSARRFVAEILAAGLVAQHEPAKVMQVMQTVRVEQGDAWAELSPAESFVINFEIEFAGTIIGHQARKLDMRNGTFVRELADCRTFCRRQDVDDMHARGLARGGSHDNALVVNGMAYENPEGPRRADECVRHKMLDALGDLALAGGPILGRYRGVRAGHGLTNRLLRLAFATPGAILPVLADANLHARLPGSGLNRADMARVG